MKTRKEHKSHKSIVKLKKSKQHIETEQETIESKTELKISSASSSTVSSTKKITKTEPYEHKSVENEIIFDENISEGDFDQSAKMNVFPIQHKPDNSVNYVVEEQTTLSAPVDMQRKEAKLSIEKVSTLIVDQTDVNESCAYDKPSRFNCAKATESVSTVYSLSEQEETTFDSFQNIAKAPKETKAKADIECIALKAKTIEEVQSHEDEYPLQSTLARTEHKAEITLTTSTPLEIHEVIVDVDQSDLLKVSVGKKLSLTPTVDYLQPITIEEVIIDCATNKLPSKRTDSVDYAQPKLTEQLTYSTAQIETAEKEGNILQTSSIQPQEIDFNLTVSYPIAIEQPIVTDSEILMNLTSAKERRASEAFVLHETKQEHIQSLFDTSQMSNDFEYETKMARVSYDGMPSSTVDTVDIYQTEQTFEKRELPPKTKAKASVEQFHSYAVSTVDTNETESELVSAKAHHKSAVETIDPLPCANIEDISVFESINMESIKTETIPESHVSHIAFELNQRTSMEMQNVYETTTDSYNKLKTVDSTFKIEDIRGNVVEIAQTNTLDSTKKIDSPEIEVAKGHELLSHLHSVGENIQVISCESTDNVTHKSIKSANARKSVDIITPMAIETVFPVEESSQIALSKTSMKNAKTDFVEDIAVSISHQWASDTVIGLEPFKVTPTKPQEKTEEIIAKAVEIHEKKSIESTEPMISPGQIIDKMKHSVVSTVDQSTHVYAEQITPMEQTNTMESFQIPAVGPILPALLESQSTIEMAAVVMDNIAEMTHERMEKNEATLSMVSHQAIEIGETIQGETSSVQFNRFTKPQEEIGRMSAIESKQIEYFQVEAMESVGKYQAKLLQKQEGAQQLQKALGSAETNETHAFGKESEIIDFRAENQTSDVAFSSINEKIIAEQIYLEQTQPLDKLKVLTEVVNSIHEDVTKSIPVVKSESVFEKETSVELKTKEQKKRIGISIGDVNKEISVSQITSFESASNRDQKLKYFMDKAEETKATNAMKTASAEFQQTIEQTSQLDMMQIHHTHCTTKFIESQYLKTIENITMENIEDIISPELPPQSHRCHLLNERALPVSLTTNVALEESPGLLKITPRKQETANFKINETSSVQPTQHVTCVDYRIGVGKATVQSHTADALKTDTIQSYETEIPFELSSQKYEAQAKSKITDLNIQETAIGTTTKYSENLTRKTKRIHKRKYSMNTNNYTNETV